MVKQQSTMGVRGNSFEQDLAVVQVLSDHEHVIDCIVWAPLESANTIQNSAYNQGQASTTTEEQPNGEEGGGTEV